MTTSTTMVDVSGFTTDAKFRTWGAAVSAAIAAAGLTQTADTGQANWTTATKPVATNTFMPTAGAYEIWRFNDSLQATKPVFIRVDYGSNGVASGNGPGTRLTIGTGTDGAGTITGVNTGAVQHGGSTVAPTNTASVIQACYVATQGFFYLGAGLNLVSGAANHGGWWVIARTCDTSGATTGDGLVVTRQATSASVLATAYGLNFNTGVLVASAVPAANYLRNASLATGSSVPLYKHYAAINVIYPLNQIMTYFASDIAANSTFSATPWGASAHTYLALPATVVDGVNAAATTSWPAAVLWE